MRNTKNNALSITQLYFELSNAGNLSAINKLLLPDATYSSTNTGLYYGKTDIIKMMKTFFESHQSLNWQIDRVHELTEHIIQVDFICKGIYKKGEDFEHKGVERIVVVDGLIKHIEVR